VAIATLKLAIALRAPVMVRVHALAAQDDIFPENLLLTEPTDPRGGLDSDCPRRLALEAEGLPFVFFEGLSLQLGTTPLAEEAVGVIHLPDRVDALVRDGLHAVRALRREQVVVVVLAVWPTLVLDEVAIGEGAPAGSAHKVLRVPLLVHSVHHGADDHLPATFTRGSVEG